jgi:dTDP-4-dehydrorhamnose 3,5-epimerase
MAKLAVRESALPGLFEIDLLVHGDDRGWFKENYQQAKLEALGLPHIDIVQHNVAFNAERGVTRGFHAEPWEKFISVATGSVFGAYLDLRAGPTFGQLFTTPLTPEKALFVPRGVANAYQTLEPNTVYTYLVNDHWSPVQTYSAVDLFDPALNVAWPIAKEHAIVSDKDLTNPLLANVSPLAW